MSAVAHDLVQIDLEAACGHGCCAELAWKFKHDLGIPKYSLGVSIMPIPESVEQWRAEHRTARKRANMAERKGYRFDEIDRSQHNDAIHEINISKPKRQGRPMSEGYTTRHDWPPLPDQPCPMHRAYTYGVLDADGILRAYLNLWRVGGLAMVSMILGHGDYEDDGIMFLLVQGVVERHAGGRGFFFYNRHDSGLPTLAWTKERYGFRAGDVEWRL